MSKRFRNFFFYYKCFFAEFLSQLWKSWRTELLSSVVIAISVFLLSYRQDPNAAKALEYTGEACGLYLAAWALYHLIRTPWKLNQHPPIYKEKPKAGTRSVDLQGEIQEIYFRNEDDRIGFPSRTYVLMKVQVVNRGSFEATITNVALQVRVGTFEAMCDLLKQIPDSWQVRHRDERYLNMVYLHTPVDTCLGQNPPAEIYRPAIPRSGWIAFELYALQNIQFPNAEFNLFLKDSLGEQHRVQRASQLYIKSGEIISVSTPSSASSD